MPEDIYRGIYQGIYLDIDMDYFVEPIELVSVDNVRVYWDKPCTLLPVGPLFQQLEESGLRWDRGNVHYFTNHKKSYTYWWMSKNKNNTVIHIDAHSDLYRNSNKDLRLLPNGELRCYNYLWYAIRDGYVDEIYWVLPTSLKHLMNEESAGLIVNKALIRECSRDEYGLHINFDCIDISGTEKSIRLHVCELAMLPKFNRTCDKVTIATSPEFIPERADCLIGELFKGFGADESAIGNINRQHKALLDIPGEELRAAKRKIGKQ